MRRILISAKSGFEIEVCGGKYRFLSNVISEVKPVPDIRDRFMLAIVLIVICLWLYYRFKRWLYAPMHVKLPFPEAAPVVRSEAVRLLEEAGYQVISGKKRVPIYVELDDEPLD